LVFSTIMIELAHGDLNNLEGRVLIYGGYINRDGEPAVMAAYASTDIVDFAERVGMDPDELKQEQDSELEAIDAQTESRNEDVDIEKVSVSFTNLREDDIEDYDCDRLYVSDWVSGNNCHTAIMAGMDIYFSRYYEQLAEKHRINLSEAHRSLAKYDPSDKSVDLGAFISKIFVTPMFFYRDRDAKNFEDLREELIAYGIASQIFNDVLALCNAVEAQAPADVVELIIAKIDAIHRADYERAAELTKQLQID